MAEQKSSAPKKEPSSGADQVKEVGGKALGAVESGVVELEKKVMGLPIDRRMIVFVGVAVLIAAFLGDFGTVVLGLIGAGLIYAGFSGDNFVARFLAPKQSKKKK